MTDDYLRLENQIETVVESREFRIDATLNRNQNKVRRLTIQIHGGIVSIADPDEGRAVCAILVHKDGSMEVRAFETHHNEVITQIKEYN